MSERDPLLALRGTIDGPVAPERAFAEELRARLLTELAAHRPPAIAEERVMDITTPGLPQSFPIPRSRRLPSWRRIAEIAAIAVILIGMLAVFTSERAGSPPPKATVPAVQGINPPLSATPQPQSEQGALLWQSPLEKTSPATGWPIALANGMIYRFQYSDDFFGVEALDAITGEIRWRTAMSGFESGIAADASGVYVTRAFTIQMPTPEPGPIHTVTALDPATGDVRWEINTGTGQKTPVVRDGVLYVQEGGSVGNANGGTSETVTAIDTSNGTVRWDTVIDIQGLGFAAGDQLAGHSLVVGDSIVVALSGRGGITALDRKTGERLWTKAQYFTNQTDLAIAGDRVIVSSPANSTLFPTLKTKFAVMAFNASDGAPLWARDLGRQPSNIAMANNIVVVVGQGYLFAAEGSPASTPPADSKDTSWATAGLNLSTGDIAWYGPAGEGDKRLPIPTVLGDGSYVLLPIGYGSYTLIDAANGNAQSGNVHLGQSIGGLPVSDGDRIYIPLENGTIVAVRAEPPPPQLSEADIAGLLPPVGNPLPPGVIWQVAQTNPWPSEAMGIPFGGMAIDGGIVYRALLSFDIGQMDQEGRGIEAYDAATGKLLWQTPIAWVDNGTTSGHAITAGDGAVFAIVDTSDDPSANLQTWDLIALDGNSGEVRWRQSFEWRTGPDFDPNAISEFETMTYRDGVLYAATSTGMVVTFDSLTGEQRWQSAAPKPVVRQGVPLPEGTVTELQPEMRQDAVSASIFADGNHLLVSTQDGVVLALDPANGRQLGTTDLPAKGGLRAFTVVGDTLIVGSTVSEVEAGGFENGVAGWLAAYDLSNGMPKLWERDNERSADQLVTLGSALFVTTGVAGAPQEERLDRINPQTGNVLWRDESLGRTIVPVASDDASVLLVQSIFDGVLFRINPQNGAVLSQSANFPAIDLIPGPDNHLYATLLDGMLVALDLTAPSSTPVASPKATPDTSAVAWRSGGEESAVYSGDLVVVGGEIVLRALSTERGNTISAFDAGTGAELWSKPFGWAGGLLSGDGVVYVPLAPEPRSANGAIAAIDPQTGEVLWETPIRGVPILPALVGDHLYAGSYDGALMMLDAKTGEAIWTTDPSWPTPDGFADPALPHSVGVGPKHIAMLVPDGRFLIFNTDDGKLLYQLPGYAYGASAQYMVVDDTLVVLFQPDDPAPPGVEFPPMLMRGIELSTGRTIWENRVVTSGGSPMVVSVTGPASDDITIQLIAEEIETSAGIYNDRGFLPGGTLSPEPVSEFVAGGFFKIDPATGKVVYDSFSTRFPYGFANAWWFPQRGPIDLSQPTFGITERVIARPGTANYYWFYLLDDGSIAAIDVSSLIPG